MSVEKDTLYGPRKIGRAAYEKQMAEQVLRGREGTKYGPRKGGPKLVTEEPSGAEASEQGKSLKSASSNPFVDGKGNRVVLGTLETELTADPSLLDLAIETEIGTGEAPRKGAIELLLKLEQARAEGPRQSVLDLLGRYQD